MTPGGTGQFTATVKDSAGNVLTGHTLAWTSSDNVVASVSSSGLVSASQPGVAVITASTNGKSGIGAASVPMASRSNAIDHVVVLLEENTEYTNVMGNAIMPYLNALANEYGYAMQYYGNTHPSIGNYFMMTSGAIISNDDNFNLVVDTPNVVRTLLAAGKTWKSYAEGLPSVGYLGQYANNNYVKHHNPFAYYSDVANDSIQRRNLVPFTQFLADLNGPGLPNYSFIVPNLCSDGHNCSLGVVDDWLHDNIGPLLRNTRFQQSGLLIITFDEGTSGTNGGGRIAWVAIGPRVRRAFTSSTRYQHQSLLRLSLEVLGINSFPNAAASAPSMMEFLTP